MTLVGVEKEVFSRIDPILRLILASIEQLDTEAKNYKSFDDHRNTNTAAAINNSNVNLKEQKTKEENGRQKILILLQTQVRLLQQLRHAIAATMTSNSQKQNKKKYNSRESFQVSSSSPSVSKISHSSIENKHRKEDQVDKNVWQLRQALFSMQEYIFLPLIIILQSAMQNKQLNQHKLQGQENATEFLLVYRSSILNSLEEAAQTLSLYVNIIHYHHYYLDDIGEGKIISAGKDDCDDTLDRDGDSDEENEINRDGDTINISRDRDNFVGTTILDAGVKLKCVMACAMALTYISTSDYHHQPVHKNYEQLSTFSDASQEKLQSTLQLHNEPLAFADEDNDKRINKGHDCTLSLLQCIQTLCMRSQLRTCSVTKEEEEIESQILELPLLHNNEIEFTHLMVQAMGGNLIARLVQSCLSCCGSYSTSLAPHTATTSIFGSNPSQACYSHHDIRGNVALKLQALRTLQSIFSLRCNEGYRQKCCKKAIDDSTGSGMVAVLRSLLPGCFAGLFKQAHTHLRFSTSTSSPKIAIESLKTLALLLKLSLTFKSRKTKDNTEIKDKNIMPPIPVVTDKVKEQHQSSNFAQAAFTQLAGVVSSSILSSTTHGVTEEISSDLVSFVNHVNEKLSPPLFVLLNLTPSHKSAKVREAGILYMCKCILVDTYSVWNKKDNDAAVSSIGNNEIQYQEMTNRNNLVDGALECLLIILGGDEVTSISAECQSIIQMCRSKIGPAMWNEKMSYSIIPRVLNLISILPTLAKSGKEIELQTHMKLITGYLSIFQDYNYLEKKKEIGLKRILASKISENPIRQSLADVFTLDNDIIGNAVKVVHNPKNDATMLSSFNISNACNFYNIQGKSSQIAKRMVHAIANIFTAKQIALFVDVCIAQLFDGLCEETRARHSHCDKYHAEWLHKHHGIIFVANEFLKSQSETMTRRWKVTTALARSIFPIIFSDPLWHLPTTLELVKIANQEADKDTLDTFLIKTRHFPEMYNDGYARRIGTVNDYTLLKVSVSALNGNSMFTAYLMELVGTISTILQRRCEGFTSTILYPLLQKSSGIYGDFVKQASLTALSRISVALGYSSTRSMLSISSNLLMETITCELQCPHQIESNHQCHYMAICFHSIEITMKNLLYDTTASKHHDNLKRVINNETHIIKLVEMLDAMLFWFNSNSKKNLKDVLSMDMIPLSLVKAFTGCAKYINELMVISKRHSAKPVNNTRCDYSEPWIDLLLQFNIKNDSCDNDQYDIGISGKDGFVAHHCDREKIIENHKTPDVQCTHSDNTLKRVANVTYHMLSLTSFFLSSANLEIQRISCDMLLNGFLLLNSVEHSSKNHKEDSDIGNPMLESVHQFWAPLRACLRSCGNSFVRTCQQQSHNSSSQLHTDRHLSILISKLLDIICTLCDLSGGSMVDNFQRDVWPVIAEIIRQFFLTTFPKVMHNPTVTKQAREMKCSKINYQISWETNILLSCLECIQTVFSGQETGLLLSQLVPTVGALVMPLLSDNGMIGDAAMDTTKVLLCVDSDCLVRGLLMMSGIGFTDRAILPLGVKIYDMDSPEYHKLSTSRRRSLQILKYIDNLPEQQLL